MTEWKKERVNCMVTWLTLVDLDQTKKGFTNTGPTKMSSLTFYNPSDSAVVRKGKARTIAVQCDNLFTRYWGAKYEDGVTRAKAINAAVRVLTDKDKTVADLAEVNNANYLYFGE